MKKSGSHFWRFGGGLLLVLVAITGLGQSYRAWRAYRLIHEAHLGPSSKDSEQLLQVAHRAHGHYPYSYHNAARAGTRAWEQYVEAREAGDAQEAAYYLNHVRHWTRIGLHYNPYPLQLRWLHMRLLAIDQSIEAAIDYWERHTDWHFWYAYNHDVLADLYTQAGRFDDAERALRMLRRSQYHAEAAAALKAARADAGSP